MLEFTTEEKAKDSKWDTYHSAVGPYSRPMEPQSGFGRAVSIREIWLNRRGVPLSVVHRPC